MVFLWKLQAKRSSIKVTCKNFGGSLPLCLHLGQIHCNKCMQLSLLYLHFDQTPSTLIVDVPYEWPQISNNNVNFGRLPPSIKTILLLALPQLLPIGFAFSDFYLYTARWFYGLMHTFRCETR